MVNLPYIPLKTYQHQLRDFIIRTPKCALWIDMGLGKTLITLAALLYLNPPKHVLITSFKQISKLTWEEEIKKWNLPFRYTSLVGLSKDERFAAFENLKGAQPSIVTINKEVLYMIPEYFGDKIPFGTLIIDEAQLIKGFNTKVTKAVMSMAPHLDRIIELTGTPAPNNWLDVWSQIYILDCGERLFDNYYTYRNAYFTPHKTFRIVGKNGNKQLHHGDWQVKPQMVPLITQKISDIVVSVDNNLVTLPPLMKKTIEVTLSPYEKHAYDYMKKEYVLPLTPDLKVSAANVAVVCAKLRQLASGFIYINENHEYALISTRKAEALAELIKHTKDDNLLVFYTFIADETVIGDALSRENIEYTIFDGSKDVKDAWDKGDIHVMLANPAKSARGLNLQMGGATIVWYNQTFNLEQKLQGTKRIWRPGQTKNVTEYELITKDTIDVDIARALADKKQSQAILTDAVTKQITYS